MKRSLPPYVYAKKGRGGKSYLYFIRPRGAKPVRLPDAADPEFFDTYARLLKGKQPAPKGKTFKELVSSYRDSERFANLAPRTKADYIKRLDYIAAKAGNVAVTSFERQHVIQMQAAGKAHEGNYRLRVMRVLLEHAIDIGWISQNPAKGVRERKGEKRTRQPWPAEKVEAFRAVATGRALLVFELCLGTGQRIGDVLKMQWGHIEGDGINVQQGKTAARLWIPFTPRLTKVLKSTPRDGLYIVSTRGHAVSYRAAHDAVMAVRRTIGAEKYDMHALRHTAAHELAAAGCNDELIQAVTGHTTTAMVRLYSGAARQKARAKQAQDKRE